jgi:hypothetical protein
LSLESSGAARSAQGTTDDPTVPRRIVTGEDAEGRSVIVSDNAISGWVQRPTGLSVAEVWHADSLPTHVQDESSGPAGAITAPAASGLAVRLAVFPPDDDIDAEKMAAYEASMSELYGDQGDLGSSHEIAGMHRTETVDILTVVDGQIWILLDEGEAVLRKGDSIIQRGTRHAWRNRSDRPCTLVSVVLPATRG